MSDIESHAKKNIMSPINYGSTITIITPKGSQMSPFKAMANFTKSKLLKKLKPNIMKSDEETQLIQSISNDSQMGFSVSSTNIDEDNINTSQNGLSNAGAGLFFNCLCLCMFLNWYDKCICTCVWI